MKRIAGIALVCAALAAPVPLFAQAIAPGEEGELANFLKPEAGKRICYARVYTPDHLAKHPKQKVTEIGFRLTYYRFPPDEFYPQDAYFRDLNTGWVAGLAGQILHTADGGQTWALQTTGTLVPIYSLAGIGADVYAAGGEGTLLKLDGDSWQRVDHGQPVRLFLRVVHAAGADRVLIGGAAGALHAVPRS